MHAIFAQPPPRPWHPYCDDPLVRSYLRRKLPPDVLAAIEPTMIELGSLVRDRLWDAQIEDQLNEPVLTPWDAWNRRIDRIAITPHWREAEQLAVRYGLTAIPYESAYGPWARTCQFALVHLFHPVTDVYTCPLAMTDGAARTLLASGNSALIERAVPRLTSRSTQNAWTSGQWMTETTGGSDVGASQTVAQRDADGTWRLYGKKWFTSATTSQMALTLARPDGNGAGGRGLALFYVETSDADGNPNGITIERLKRKLGTRKVPTAELTLDGTVAHLVGDASHGTRAIEPMLRITRAWNSVCAASFARFGLGLARDYAVKRQAFGAPLASRPLHQETLADVDAESGAAFALTFYLCELLGADEMGGLDADRAALLRVLLPIVKATTGRQVVTVMSEVVEAFGGAGYVEDTGVPTLLRDAQVLPIWEGTTNVLSLDLLLRTDLATGVNALRRVALEAVSRAPDAMLRRCADSVRTTLDHAWHWHQQTRDEAVRERGARRFALTLGRALALALLVEHAAGATDESERFAARHTAQHFQALGTDLIRDEASS